MIPVDMILLLFNMKLALHTKLKQANPMKCEYESGQFIAHL